MSNLGLPVRIAAALTAVILSPLILAIAAVIGAAALPVGAYLFTRALIDTISEGHQWRRARRELPQHAPLLPGDHEACDVPDLEADQFARIAARYPNLGKEVER